MRRFDFYFANSWKRASILFHLIGLLFIANFPSVISLLRSNKCNNASTYADGSAYSSNLDQVLSDLVMNAPQTGFNTSVYGENGNRVYGLLQCRGNMSQQDCSICSQEANTRVRQKICGNDTGAKVWQDKCFLRYDNYSFFSKLETEGDMWLNINDVVTSNLSDFRTTTSNLLSNLSDRACQPANNGFAEGSIGSSSVGGTIQGIVQCWRDISINDCRSCLQVGRKRINDCCFMKQEAEALLPSCTVRFGILPFSSVPSGANPPTVSSTSKKSSSKTLPITLGIVGGVVIILIVCLFALWSKLKSAILKRTVTSTQKEESMLLKHEEILFTLEEIIEATDNFNENNKLGDGGYGPVYRGRTRDGNEIAVKKLSVRSGHGKLEFVNEVKLVANLQHRNLVRLLGCCAEGPERLLVYEYLSNNSLDSILFDPEKKSQLDWQRRYNIIIGIARGLLYLHEDSHLRIIHRDIKTSNILLDERLNPKIADSGLARFFPEDEDETHIRKKIAKKYGYMAPEYAKHGKLSVKVDIYSFGVLILEIVSGRKNNDTNFPQEIQTLLEWAWILYKDGNLVNMIDSTLKKTCQEEEALRCILVALLCTQADASIRPTISNVILMMSSANELPTPTERAFVKSSDSNLSVYFPSINDVTISELEAR